MAIGRLKPSMIDFTGAAANQALTFNAALNVVSFESISDLTSSSSSATWLEKTANYTVSAGENLFVDSSGGTITITLPASATLGDEIRIVDATGSASSNNITIARNSHNIQGAAEDLTVDTDRAAFGMVYYNATQGWLLKER